MENGSWVVNGFFFVKFCLGEKFYFGFYFFFCKVLILFFMSIRWFWRKIFRISFFEEESDGDYRGMVIKRGENGSIGFENRGEKVRRKVEEKR